MARRSLKGIQETLTTMKRADNSWLEAYVRDVAYLLLLLQQVREVLTEARGWLDDSCYNDQLHVTIRRVDALLSKLKVED